VKIHDLESIPEKVSNDSNDDDIYNEYIEEKLNFELEKNIVITKIADYEKKIKSLEQTIVKLQEIIEDKDKIIRIARKNVSQYQEINAIEVLERTCNCNEYCIIS